MRTLYLDSEFNSDAVVCFCVEDGIGGRWDFDTLTADGRADFARFVADNSDALFVAYSIGAEIESMLRLGIEPPEAWVDLMPEAGQITMTHPKFRVIVGSDKYGRRTVNNHKAIGLLKAVELFTGDAGDSDRKHDTRDLILSKRVYSASEMAAIIDYCYSDTAVLPTLWAAVQAFHKRNRTLWQMDHALYRGALIRACAVMQYRSSGFTVDEEWLRAIYDNRTFIIHRQIDALAKAIPGYHLYRKTQTGASVNMAECRRYASENGLPWAETGAGRMAMSEDYLDEFTKLCPSLRPFKETRDLIIQLAKNLWLEGDPKKYLPPLIQNGAVKAVSLPFYTKTGRSQPMVNRGHILNARPFIRTIIRPAPGKVIVAGDWSQQEIAIALAYFPDAKLRALYEKGDIYLEMGKLAGAIPPDGTKHSHPLIRQAYKAVQLGLGYGMGETALGRKLFADLNAGSPTIIISREEAAKRASAIYKWHRETFTDYWSAVDRFVAKLRREGQTSTHDHWLYFADGKTPKTQLQNLRMQSNGAAMLHYALVEIYAQGFDFLAEHHDAVYVQCDEADKDVVAAKLVEIMNDAAEAVIGFSGIKIRVDPKFFTHESGYQDERASDMVRLLNQHLSAQLAA